MLCYAGFTLRLASELLPPLHTADSNCEVGGHLVGKAATPSLISEETYPPRRYASLRSVPLLRALPAIPHEGPAVMPTESHGTKIAVLETRVSSLSDDIREIKTGLASIQTTLKERTLPVDSITWKLLALVFVCLLTLSSTLVGAYTWWNSSKIAAAEKRADDVQTNANNRFQVLDVKLVDLEKKFDERLKEIHNELKEFIKPFIKTPNDVVVTTKRALLAPPEKLRYALRAAQSVLAVAKEKGIALQAQQIQEMVQPIRRARPTDPILAEGVEDTLSAVASYKSFSDSRLHRLPQTVIDNAISSGNYFSKKEIHLGTRSLWENTVFKDCDIITGSGSAKLILKNTSFVNCTFRHEVSNDLAGERLNAAVIDSPIPTISVVLYDFPVSDKPKGS